MIDDFETFRQLKIGHLMKRQEELFKEIELLKSSTDSNNFSKSLDLFKELNSVNEKILNFLNEEIDEHVKMEQK